MKRLDTHSQNFLRNPKLVLELIGHSTIKKGDTVLEIGAGSGVITSSLATRAATVIAYEYDARMVSKLKDNLSRFDNVTVVQGDFLQAKLPESPYKLFANIPFHLSSPIIKKLTESPNRPQAIYLIVQKQFGNKFLIGKTDFTGMLGAQVAPLYTARIRQRLLKSDFSPQPAVDTVFLELILKPEPLLPEEKLPRYRELIEKCFSEQKFFAGAPFEKAGIRPNKRPSELTTEEWVTLFKLSSRS